ncbi:hypothetical protein JD844_001838 [Phrynosoma platyrhinos]|uniref:IRF tryptophan pentad repeat domain-containing protein n=1 Tax=Phrynosoma platyrhinos TaxID=52577 RepID=A0ABQ7TAF9_PHRPL|nr:hypothetical protein JD844_001838 [Phrynosoma platyrhinos]
MGAQRPLIVPWLIEQLDAQKYPGVSWLNPERTQFRVTWKHGSRQSISSEDFQLFEDWAIARGRYCPGVDERTPSDWKRNFRSALNRKDGIEMIQDNSTDSEDPHKVFEIKQPNNASKELRWDRPDEPLEHVLSGLDLSSSQEVVGAENPVCSDSLSPPSLNFAQPIVTAQPLDQLLEAETLDVVFPDPAILNDRTQASYTQRIVQKVAPGVLLCIEGQLLCGMRQGHCHVYWSQSEFPADGMLHGELRKEQLDPIYSLQQFVHGMSALPFFDPWRSPCKGFAYFTPAPVSIDHLP